MKKPKQIIKETFEIDETVGACAALIGLRKKGYTISEINRKGKKAVVTYRLIIVDTLLKGGDSYYAAKRSK